MGQGCSSPGGTGSAQEVLLCDISLEYSEARLREATEDFHPGRLLGQGKYGSVYHGSLPEGTEVAIKVLEAEVTGAAESGFAHEVRVLSKFRHPNLVTLMGWGRQGGRHFLVYEFLEGGDVHERLGRCRAEGLPFTCAQRLWVARDAACGLAHMMNSTPRAFHRDIKTANILLTKSGEAKMGDFGLAGVAKAQGEEADGLDSTTICGTPGYCCPHYLCSGRVSEQSEAYAFGMAALALLLNELPASLEPGGDMAFPVFEIVRPMHAGAVERAAAACDPHARWPAELARRLAEDVALPCSAYEVSARPSFMTVAGRLRSLVDEFCGGQRGELLPQWAACQPPPVEVAVPWPTGSWDAGTIAVLECVAASGTDINRIPYEDRCIPLRSGEGPWALGPEFQPEIFERLAPSEALRGHVSMSPFQLSEETGDGAEEVEPASACSAAAPLERALRLSRLTPGRVLVDRQREEAPQGVLVADGTRIGFCNSGDSMPLLVFLLHVRSVAKTEEAEMPAIPEVPEEDPPPSAAELLLPAPAPQALGPQAEEAAPPPPAPLLMLTDGSVEPPSRAASADEPAEPAPADEPAEPAARADEPAEEAPAAAVPPASAAEVAAAAAGAAAARGARSGGAHVAPASMQLARPRRAAAAAPASWQPGRQTRGRAALEQALRRPLPAEPIPQPPLPQPGATEEPAAAPQEAALFVLTRAAALRAPGSLPLQRGLADSPWGAPARGRQPVSERVPRSRERAGAQPGPAQPPTKGALAVRGMLRAAQGSDMGA